MLTTNQQLIPLGRVKGGQSYNFSYVLSNSEAETLHVTRLHAGCGRCTEASIDDVNLSTGASTKLNAVFTPNSSGLQSKSITVYYTIGEDKAEKSLQLKFTADVYGS